MKSTILHCGTAFICSALLSCSAASAAVTFTVQFEAGSKWFTESWSAAARTEMMAFFADLGQHFNSTAQVTVEINDNETSAYASASALWSAPTGVEGRTGQFYAPSVWWIIVKGVDQNGSDADVRINWNLDVDGLYSGSSAQMINNYRGLGRHEMQHPFGSISRLSHSASYDPRGMSLSANLIDSLYRDANDAPLMGAFNAASGRFTVNDYALSANWDTESNQSGCYFEARNIRGEIVKMPPISYGGRIDFSHVTGIAYVSDHPSWRNIENTDRNFWRALGYPLAADAALAARAPVAKFRLNGGNAELTAATRSTHFYRVSKSRDMINWFVQPKGLRGADGTTLLTLAADPTKDPMQFFQIVEIP